MSGFKDLLNESSLNVDIAEIDTITVSTELDVSSASVLGLPCDEISVTYAGNVISVKDYGISTAKIASLAVTDPKIASVSADKISQPFSSLNVTGNITVGGLVDGVDIADMRVDVNTNTLAIADNANDILTLETELDTFPDALKNLTNAEINQLENIGTTTITAPNWSYVSTLDQDLSSADSVQFANVSINIVLRCDPIS